MHALERLLHFSTHCLRVPARCGHRSSLASQVNKQLWEDDPPTTTRIPRRGKGKVKDPMEYLGRRVSEKLEEGGLYGSCSYSML